MFALASSGSAFYKQERRLLSGRSSSEETHRFEARTVVSVEGGAMVIEGTKWFLFGIWCYLRDRRRHGEE